MMIRFRVAGSNDPLSPEPGMRKTAMKCHPDIRPTRREEMNLAPIETFEYEYPGREIHIHFTCPEWTAICPFSDFPDFGTIKIDYVPNHACVELKSLKLYINSYRSVKIFHEHVVNQILEDFVTACDPLSVEIEGDFNVRGNIKTVIKASYRRPARRRNPR